MAITERAALIIAGNLASNVGWNLIPWGPGSGRMLLEGPEVNNVSPAVIISFDLNDDTAVKVLAKCNRIQTWITNMQANAPVT